MSRQEEPLPERASSPDRTVDARQLWSGGAATAVVAALIALVGILVSRWLFNIPLLAPRQDGAWGDASTAEYAITAAAAALAATAVTPQMQRAQPTDKTAVALVVDARCDWMETRGLPWHTSRFGSQGTAYCTTREFGHETTSCRQRAKRPMTGRW